MIRIDKTRQLKQSVRHVLLGTIHQIRLNHPKSLGMLDNFVNGDHI